MKRLDEEELNGEGTCLDTVKPRPTYRFAAYKKAKKRCADMEELKQMVDRRKYLRLSKEDLEKILKD